MMKNLETADAIAKVVLSGGTAVLFLGGAIAGPLANLLVVLSGVIMAIFLVKVISGRLTSRSKAGDDL
jgi:hypothetical protein